MARSLHVRAYTQLAVTLALLGVVLFIPAGTLRFWPASLFLGSMALSWGYFTFDLLRHDPELVRRRMQAAETDPRQKLFQRLWVLILFPAFVVAGLDYRFGWSRALAPVPTSVIIAGQLLTQVGYWFVFWVTKTNTFAGSTIRVESEQTVIHRGPYALVRHPMYLGMSLTFLGSPLALASYVSIPVFLALIPVLIYRLIHEERTLHRDLPGYSDYCQRTRDRLIPRVW